MENKVIFALVLLCSLFAYFNGATQAQGTSDQPTGKQSLFDFTVTSISGEQVPLSTYKGKVILLVNTASKCGFTPQLKDLETVYEKYKGKGFEVLGFPSNDFLGQEPLPDVEIKKFCTGEYGVTFPLFAKNPVSGAGIQPVFKFLTQESDEEFQGSVKWNFEKFVVDRNGILRARFGSFTNPMSTRLQKAIEDIL